MDRPTLNSPSKYTKVLRHSVLIVAALVQGLTTTACQVVNRYGSQSESAVITTRAESGSATSLDADSRMTGWKTTDYIRFGMLVQKELGRPHRSRSSSDRSLDCSEFTRSVFEAFDGRQLPRTAALQAEQGKPVERDKLGYGDLVFFRINGTTVSHVGIAVGFGEFIHVSEQSGVIVSSLSDQYWAQRFAGARRILNIAG